MPEWWRVSRGEFLRSSGRELEMKQQLIRVIVLAVTAAMASADDIDIYLSEGPSSQPYLFLILDVSEQAFETVCARTEDCAPPYLSPAAYDKLIELGAAENSPMTRLALFRAVFAAVLERPELDGLQLAIGVSNWGQGASLLSGYQPVATARKDLIDILSALPEQMDADESHKFNPVAAYLEWYHYINGEAVLYGNQSKGNFQDSEQPSYDPAIIDGAFYRSPFSDPEACPRLLSLLMSMQSETELNAADPLDLQDIATAFPVAGLSSIEQALEVLHEADRDLLPGVNGLQSLEKTWLVVPGEHQSTSGLAQIAGTTTPLSLAAPQDLEQALISVMEQAVNTSSTLLAPSAPMPMSVWGESLDQLYVPLFEAQDQVSWPGNIKRLKLTRTSSESGAARDEFSGIVDVKGTTAIETTADQRVQIRFDALSFWTDVSSLPPAAGPDVPEGADGRVVTRGGAGQKIPGFIASSGDELGDSNSEFSRQLYTEPALLSNGTDNLLLPFNATLATLSLLPDLPSDLATASVEETLDMIRWARGQDRDDIDHDGSRSDPRPWILGEVLHSRPLAINYGATPGYSAEQPNVRVFFGSGDGIFHVLESSSSSGQPSGRELYGFLPRDTLGILAHKRANTRAARYMPYGVDGAAVAMTRDVNQDGHLRAADGDEVLVYFGLRRGGSSYYALDVSDPSVPPILRWKVSRTEGGDFDHLALSFSEPVVGRVKYAATAQDVVVFAGGYNGGWKADFSAKIGKDAGADTDDIGNAIYIVNARSGALIWKAVAGTTGVSSNRHFEHSDLLHSIPSTVTALRDNSGNIHRLYVGDTGGALWRVDLPPGDAHDHRAKNWSLSKLAELGTNEPDGDRRFFHAPDVVQVRGADGQPFDGILIASGDRADPRKTSVLNELFYLKDYLLSSGDPATRSRQALQRSDLLSRSDCVLGSESACEGAAHNGWRIELKQPGEKGLSSPLTVGGKVFFTSFVAPTKGAACEPDLGRGLLYVVNLKDGSAAYGSQRFYSIGPGIPPSVSLIGDTLLLPGGGASLGETEGGHSKGLDSLYVIPDRGLFRLYWRETDIDKL